MVEIDGNDDNDSVDWVYETPDGGKTIYRRRLGSPIKEIVRSVDAPTVGTFAEWIQIVELSRTNPTLREALEHIIIIYRLTKK